MGEFEIAVANADITKWSHVAIVAGSGSVKFYFNGEPSNWRRSIHRDFDAAGFPAYCLASYGGVGFGQRRRVFTLFSAKENLGWDYEIEISFGRN